MPTNVSNPGALKQRLDQHLDNIRNTPEPNGAAGFVSLLGLTAIIGYLAFHFGGFGVAFSELPTFLNGGALGLAHNNATVATGLATVILMMAASFVSLPIVAMMAGKSKGEHAIGKEFAQMQMGNQFGSLLFIVLLEELFARGLCLGLLTKLPFLSGTVGFYTMFLLGNSLWAAIHLTNFTSKEDRSIWRVLPQFLSGVLITYIFVKYGFIAGFMVHLGFDALLFSTHKVEKLTGRDVWAAIYGVLTAGVAFYLMDKPLSDLAPWVNSHVASFRIPGWDFLDYFKAYVFALGVSAAVSGILLFDRSRPPAKATKNGNQQMTVMALVLGSFIITGAIFIAYWAMGFAVHDMATRALVIGIAFACTQRGRSGSSVARSFWFAIPCMFIVLCTMEALGFWQAMGMMMASMVVQLPVTSLKPETN